jgi:2-octaprenyl-6-methoxyphenol hydroxylase
MSSHPTYDAIIVGGGLSGLTLACLLGQRGMNIAVIDQADPKKKPKDLRTTAISFGSRAVLEKAGIWDGIQQSCAIKDIQILDGHSPVLLEFMSAEVQDKSFGWIVDNHDLKCAMMARLKTLKSVNHIAPAIVSDYAVEEGRAYVTLADGAKIEAKLIIGADGRGSGVREWMVAHCGVQTRGWQYKQRAVICTAMHENPHDNVAVEHFWPEGPFAILPMADDETGAHQSSVVFTEHGPEKNSLMHFSDEEFEIALAARFPERYGDVKLGSRRVAYPLGLVHADRYIAPRMVLVADAAHGIHPIAGQGLNLGFRDLDALDDILGTAYENGADIGEADLLEAYQMRRRPDNMAMVAVTDALNRLFSNNIPPVRLVRRAGLKIVSRLKPAKKFFMKQAMGDR